MFSSQNDLVHIRGVNIHPLIFELPSRFVVSFHDFKRGSVDSSAQKLCHFRQRPVAC